MSVSASWNSSFTAPTSVIYGAWIGYRYYLQKCLARITSTARSSARCGYHCRCYHHHHHRRHLKSPKQLKLLQGALFWEQIVTSNRKLQLSRSACHETDTHDNPRRLVRRFDRRALFVATLRHVMRMTTPQSVVWLPISVSVCVREACKNGWIHRQLRRDSFERIFSVHRECYVKITNTVQLLLLLLLLQ